MPPRLQWRVELVAEEFIVPRLENHEIDDLFYQDDEIGEFRHTAFMIECGLEEDPPDGPDVPPVPWGEMLLNQQQEEIAPETQVSPETRPKRIYSRSEIIVAMASAAERARNGNSTSNRNLMNTVEKTYHSWIGRKMVAVANRAKKKMLADKLVSGNDPLDHSRK